MHGSYEMGRNDVGMLKFPQQAHLILVLMIRKKRNLSRVLKRQKKKNVAIKTAWNGEVQTG